ncbi:MAG TPA: response regulator transcription factor [Chthoniobacteraceae bacterium]|jgi:DNA-binding NarL/FixJ family response regulator|nr:DNA-binding response regulator [Chthoniobacter sp.]HEV7866817.1 response regulator transcription factor [Chthoniobacteraceae bacterium]
MERPLRILLVDDHEVVRRGVRALLEHQPEWVMCCEAAEGREAVRSAVEHQPDLVIMDIGMPRLNGFEATRQIRRRVSGVEVLILSMHESEQLIREVISAGARGYVLKSDAGRDLVAAVSALSRHEPFFTSAVAKKVFAETVDLKPKRGRPKASGLTPREREVLQLVAEGLGNRAVGERLGIRLKTAETHRARIMRKTGASSVAELVLYAIRERIIQP